MTDSLRNKVLSGLLWSAVQNWGTRLSGLLLFMVIARLLSPEQLGLFAATSVVLLFLNLLADQGLTEAVVQTKQISDSQLSAVFWINLAVASAVVGIVWFTAPLIAAWMKLPDLVDLLRAASLAVPVSAAALGQTAILRRQFKYRRLAATSLISTTVAGLIALAMAFGGLGVWSLIAQSVATAALTTTLLWANPEWKLTTGADFKSAQPLMRYGANRLVTYVLDFANNKYIEIFVVATLGPVALGLYSVGVRFYQALMQALSSIVLEVAHNGFSRLSDDRNSLIKAYYGSVTATAALAVPIFCLVAAIAPDLTAVLFGEKWIESAYITRPMACLGAVQVLQFINGTLYNAIGKPAIGMWFMVMKVILTAVALYLAKDLGLVSLVYSYVISQLLTAPISFYLAKKLVGISLRVLVEKISPFFAATLVMVAFVGGTTVLLGVEGRHSPVLNLVACLIMGPSGYIGFLICFYPAQIKDVAALFRKNKNR